MASLKHDFEGIASGTTLTQGIGGNTNTAGGNYFDLVNIATGGVCQADSAAAYEGAGGMRLATRGTGGVTGVIWRTQLGTLGDFYLRTFFKLTGQPANFSNSFIVVLRPSTGSGLQGALALNTNGSAQTHVVLINGASGIVVTGNDQIVPNTWYRLEAFVHSDAAAGYITARLYVDPTSSTFAQEMNPGGVTSTWVMSNALTGDVEFHIDGGLTNWPTSTGFLDFDHVDAGQTTGWYGPITQTILPDADIAVTGWGPTPLFSRLNDASDATVGTAVAV